MSASYFYRNGVITIKAVQDGVNYEITGKREANEILTSKIIITDGDKKTEVEKVDSVPEQYRPVVQRLLKGNQGRVRD